MRGCDWWDRVRRSGDLITASNSAGETTRGRARRARAAAREAVRHLRFLRDVVRNRICLERLRSGADVNPSRRAVRSPTRLLTTEQSAGRKASMWYQQGNSQVFVLTGYRSTTRDFTIRMSSRGLHHVEGGSTIAQREQESRKANAPVVRVNSDTTETLYHLHSRPNASKDAEGQEVGVSSVVTVSGSARGARNARMPLVEVGSGCQRDEESGQGVGWLELTAGRAEQQAH